MSDVWNEELGRVGNSKIFFNPVHLSGRGGEEKGERMQYLHGWILAQMSSLIRTPFRFHPHSFSLVCFSPDRRSQFSARFHSVISRTLERKESEVGEREGMMHTCFITSEIDPLNAYLLELTFINRIYLKEKKGQKKRKKTR